MKSEDTTGSEYIIQTLNVLNLENENPSKLKDNLYRHIHEQLQRAGWRALRGGGRLCSYKMMTCLRRAAYGSGLA